MIKCKSDKTNTRFLEERIMKKGLAMVLGASMVMGMAMPACAADADLVYAVEAGSAGEAAAKRMVPV